MRRGDELNGRPAGVVPRRKGAVKGQGRCCKGDLYMRKAIYAGFPRRSIILCWKRGEAGEHDCTEMTFQLPIVRPYKVQRSCLPTEQPGRFAPFPPAQRSAFLCFFPPRTLRCSFLPPPPWRHDRARWEQPTLSFWRSHVRAVRLPGGRAYGGLYLVGVAGLVAVEY